MQTKRYNLFNQIHKALRGMMYHAAANIQRTDFSAPEAAATINELESLLRLLDDHAEHEDNYILPHVLRHEPKLVEAFEQDHIIDHRLTASLYEQIAAWRASGNPEQKAAIGYKLFYAFNELIAFNLYHMNKEENELSFVLWKHCTDAELIGMQQEIMASIAPETLMVESAWMMRSLSNPEIIGWLGAVRATAPAEVFGGLIRLAEEVLPQPRFAQIAAAVCPEPAMA